MRVWIARRESAVRRNMRRGEEGRVRRRRRPVWVTTIPATTTDTAATTASAVLWYRPSLPAKPHTD